MSCRRVRKKKREKKRREHLRSFTICCASAHGAEGLPSSVTCYSSFTPQCPALMLLLLVFLSCNVFVCFDWNAVFRIITCFFASLRQQLWSNPLVCHLVKCLLLRSTSFISQLVERRRGRGRSAEHRQNKQTNKQQTNESNGRFNVLIQRSFSLFFLLIYRKHLTQKKNKRKYSYSCNWAH